MFQMFPLVCILLVLGRVLADPQLNIISIEDQERIAECARLTGHFSTEVLDKVYTSKGCEINRRFNKNQLTNILSGVNLNVDDMELSFKRPIQTVQFQVPDHWASERKSHKKRFFGHKKDIETPTYMFTTFDGLFLISPISSLEFQSFQEGLADYAKHMKNTPDSLLIRVVGMFKTGNNLHYAIYVSPFRPLENSHFVLEISQEDQSHNYPKFQGLFPFGNKEWGELTENGAMPISEEDERRFENIYEKDMLVRGQTSAPLSVILS